MLALSSVPVAADGWRDLFFDATDGMFDLSGLLARGGFVPVPVIVTEPAVEGGLGIVGQFVHGNPTEGNVSRTIVGGVYTGNDSWGAGLMHSGNLLENRLKFTVGLGSGDVNLPIYPFGGSAAVEYNNKVSGVFANARYQLGDGDWYTGPRLSYRTSEVSINAEGRLAELVDRLLSRFKTEQTYAALGWSLHYDSRDNPITPANGINAVIRYDQYSDDIGSDASFGVGRATVHGFNTNDTGWSLATMADYQWVAQDTPFSFAPSVSLRGVSYGRYTGENALSIETEVKKQITPRWSGLVFGGYGQSDGDASRLYTTESGLWTYGAGFRYRIAKKLGLDAGIDVARGPEETIWYIQFGHAWMRTMD